MAKDPAFLFYSKDWIEGTMEMTAEEKGVYIDLLAHQHQKGTLPSETKRLCKLVGLSESDFLPIWAGIKQKFKPTEDNRLHNLRLTGVVTERSEVGRKNKIIGLLAVAVRQSEKSAHLKSLAKKGFRVEDFIPIPDQELSKRITEWFTERLASLEDGNGTANGNEDKDIRGGMGEEKFLNGFAVYDAEKEIIKNPIRFEEICASTGKTIEDAKVSLRKYHLFLQDKEQYPKGRAAVFAGFEKWLMNEKKHINGQKTSHSVGKTFEADKF